MTDEEIAETAEMIAALLRDQHPDLADLPLDLAALGWDNQMWRLGSELVVRLPWATSDADDLLVHEHRWMPTLVPHLPLPVPVPLRLGEPSSRFPRPWLVSTWVDGLPADRAPAASRRSGELLADFLGALHRPAPDGAPAGRHGRGGALSASHPGFVRGLDEAVGRGLVDDADAVRAVWDDAVAAAPWTSPRVWLHADLHPANVLTRDSVLCGVVDFGDLCAGDPACDLAAIWSLLPDGPAEHVLDRYGPVDGDTVRRARGWAVGKALACLLIGDAGVHGRPGGKATWGRPPRRRCAG